MIASLRRPKRRWLGGLVVFLLLIGLAEAYLRFFPPEDLHPYLGDSSPRRGPWVASSEFGVAYRSWQDFQNDNSHILCPRQPLLFPESSDAPTAWLLLGNSFGFDFCRFVQNTRPGQPALTLDRREELTVRMAQIRTLLENGARPKRILLVVTPIDFRSLGEHGLDHVYINAQ